MKLKIYLSLIITILFAQNSNAQWTHLNEPTGGNCWAIEKVGNEIWAAYDYGIYVSTNDGATWSHHPTLYYPTMDIKAIGDTVIILIQEAPSLLNYNLSTITSFDGGVTWGNPVVLETGNSYYAYGSRKIFVTDSSLVVQQGVFEDYVSFDYGLTWDTLIYPTGAGQLKASSKKFLIYLVYSPIFATYVSDNGGKSWMFLDSLHAGQDAFIRDSTFYFSAYYSDTSNHFYISRTSDFGLTWDTLALDLLTDPARYIESFNGKLYYKCYPYPNPPVEYESSDGGNTWIPSALPIDLFWLETDNCVLLSNWEWLINSDARLYRYNPNSSTAFHTETGINCQPIRFLKENKGALFAGTSKCMFASYDAGSTWNELPVFINSSGPFLFKGDTIYGSTDPFLNQCLMCSSFDNGHTWDTVPFINGTHWIQPRCMAEFNNKLFIANVNYTAYSSNWGASWDSLSTFEDSTCTSFGIFGDDLVSFNNELYLNDHFHKKLSKYDSLTQTWKKLYCTNFPGTSNLRLSTIDNYLTLTDAYKFFISNDSGHTWIAPLRLGLPTYFSNIFEPNCVTSFNGVWIGSCSGKIYYSFDHGDNWQLYPSDSNMFISNSSNSFAIHNDIVFASGNGIWRNNDTLHIISGNVYFDNNNNGFKDVNEKGIPYNLLYTFPYNIAFNADSSGNYAFLTAAVGDTLRPALPTNFCASNPGFYLTNGAASNVDFGIYFYPGILDVAVDITNTNNFRPGFNTNIEVTATNYGSVSVPAQLTVNLDSNLTYISSSIVPTQITGNTIFFTTDTLHILESEKITIQTETNFTVPFGTQIICDVTVNPLSGDTVPSNNYSQLMDSVVASFDPNEKSCASGSYFPITQVLNGDEMIYTIRFQNLGNIQADNIHIIDTLSELFDYSSFRIISSSHTMHYSIAGNGIVTYYFDNIFLPEAVTDEPGSHGFVKYAVKFKTTVSTGNAVDNTAYIYFDFNPAIITNTVTTLVADPPLNMNIVEIKPDAQLSIYPNPVISILNGVIVDGKISNFNLSIYNQLGQCLVTKMINGNRFEFNVTDLLNGLYFGKIFIAATNEQKSFRFIVAH